MNRLPGSSSGTNAHTYFASPQSYLDSSASQSRTLGIDDSVTLGEADSFTPQSVSLTSDGAAAPTRPTLEAPATERKRYFGPPPAPNQGLPNLQRKWTSLFQDRKSDDLKLESFATNKECVSLDSDDVCDVPVDWGHCLLGRFADRFPGIKAITNLVQSWKMNCTLIPYTNGCVIFKFTELTDLEKILHGGPFHVFGRTLLLKKLTNGVLFRDDELSFVPIWAKFPNLPLECWHPRAMGKLASFIGKPMCSDRLTHEKKRVSFARLLIEVDASCPLPDSIQVNLPDGQSFQQKVIYEHSPKFCKACRSFGHFQGSCPGDPVNQKPTLNRPPAPKKPTPIGTNTTTAVPTSPISDLIANPKISNGNIDTLPTNKPIPCAEGTLPTPNTAALAVSCDIPVTPPSPKHTTTPAPQNIASGTQTPAADSNVDEMTTEQAKTSDLLICNSLPPLSSDTVIPLQGTNEEKLESSIPAVMAPGQKDHSSSTAAYTSVGNASNRKKKKKVSGTGKVAKPPLTVISKSVSLGKFGKKLPHS